VNWTLGSGKGLSLAGDRIAILNSTFTQTINYQNGDASQKTGGMGPFYLGPVSNLQFRNNAVKWATDQNSIHDAVNAVIENNTFTRSASDALTVGPAELLWSQASWNNFRLGDKIMRVMGRQLAINFARNAVVQYNTFGVSDGALKYNWNDGETIQNEAGGPNSREDAGTVTAADGSSISDDSKCAGPCVWKYTPAYSMVVVVSGAGAGQWRRITAQAGNKFTVDRPFDVVPAPGDHFTVSYPAYENAIIRGNRMSGNPKGIDLYHGAMLNVSIVGNTLTNNGGIDIIGTQRNLVDSAAAKLTNFSVSRNIEIIGNTISNTTGAFPAYIVVGGFQQCWQPTFWGKSAIGVEVRNNQLIARTGTFPFPYSEGFQAFALYQYPGAPYIDQGVGPLVGTVFQGNKCSNCPASYTLSTGAVNTTIWNATTVTSPGLASKFLNDYAFIPTTRTTSIRTVSGQD
jgi:hypothetical protein